MIILSPDAIDDVIRLRSFLDQVNPGAARRAMELIFATIDRLQEFPDRGRETTDPDIRQVIIRFGASGYVVRYAVLSDTHDILITRIWHGREIRA
jgi:plasmid stabilization system protein ParE